MNIQIYTMKLCFDHCLMLLDCSLKIWNAVALAHKPSKNRLLEISTKSFFIGLLFITKICLLVDYLLLPIDCFAKIWMLSRLLPIQYPGYQSNALHFISRLQLSTLKPSVLFHNWIVESINWLVILNNRMPIL